MAFLPTFPTFPLLHLVLHTVAMWLNFCREKEWGLGMDVLVCTDGRRLSTPLSFLLCPIGGAVAILGKYRSPSRGDGERAEDWVWEKREARRLAPKQLQGEGWWWWWWEGWGSNSRRAWTRAGEEQMQTQEDYP